MLDDLAAALRDRIAAQGPICVSDYMAAANAHYYATRDPLGAGGDFITAPEISQMFGELIGLWCADLWARAGRPDAAYVELGPGRGTLAADALRAMRAAGLTPPVHFLETSPVLRGAQAQRVPHAIWCEDIASLPDDQPLLVIANEFFDALAVEQFVHDGAAWRRLVVAADADNFSREPGPVVEAPTTRGRAGQVFERSPAGLDIVRGLAERLVRQGGAMLIIDYGHAQSGFGDTLQAVSRHAFADPWTAPGTRDLTAHVDFAALAATARSAGAHAYGPIDQSVLLEALGIGARAAALAASHPERADEIAAARERLVGPDQMGSLFKAVAIVAPDWPVPAAFA